MGGPLRPFAMRSTKGRHVDMSQRGNSTTSPRSLPSPRRGLLLVNARRVALETREDARRLNLDLQDHACLRILTRYNLQHILPWQDTSTGGASSWLPDLSDSSSCLHPILVQVVCHASHLRASASHQAKLVRIHSRLMGLGYYTCRAQKLVP